MVHHLHGAVEIERCLRQQVSRVLWRQSCNAQAKSGAARTGFSPSAAIFQRRGYRSLFLDPVIVAKLRIVFCQIGQIANCSFLVERNITLLDPCAALCCVRHDPPLLKDRPAMKPLRSRPARSDDTSTTPVATVARQESDPPRGGASLDAQPEVGVEAHGHRLLEHHNVLLPPARGPLPRIQARISTPEAAFAWRKGGSLRRRGCGRPATRRRTLAAPSRSSGARPPRPVGAGPPCRA